MGTLFRTAGPIAYRVVALSSALALGGCASLLQGVSASKSLPFERTVEEHSCVDWLSTLDTAIDAAGIADAEAMRLPGFPHLRVNRFLASFRDELDTPEKWAAWLDRLGRLGKERRAVEISNLPASSLPGVSADRVDAAARMRRCGDLLARADLASPARLAVLRDLTIVPDDYSSWLRAVGIYPLVRIPFLFGVRAWQRRTLEAFAQASAAPEPPSRWQEYAIAQGGNDDFLKSAILTPVSRDALGIPVTDAQKLQRLASRHAPLFRIETAGTHDIFGGLSIVGGDVNRDAAGTNFRVDIGSPSVYVRHDFTRVGKMSLLQLTYTVWFPERPADHAFDLLSGKLAGVMVRLTFAPNGEIIMVDSAHACGCYHLFFPSERAALRAAPDALEEWAFAPTGMPTLGTGQRLRVWVASRTHYLVGLDSGESTNTATKYSLSTSEAMLKANEQAVGEVKSRSLYSPNGLVAGTERGERFLFWPMGIASAGQMRQWGHHATAFVGRRHFDDARLIERYFEVSLPAQP